MDVDNTVRGDLGKVSNSVIVGKCSGSPQSRYNRLRCVVCTVGIYILSRIKGAMIKRRRERKERKKVVNKECSRCRDNHNTPPHREHSSLRGVLNYLMPKKLRKRVNLCVSRAFVNISAILSWVLMYERVIS